MDPLQDEPRADVRQIRGSLQQQITPSTLRSSVIAQSIACGPAVDSSVCRWCKGAGYTRKDAPYGHPNFGKIEKCVCKLEAEREKRKQDLLRFSQLGFLAEKTFASFNGLVPGTQEAYTAAWEYAHCPDGWLLLIGTNGCGKTHLAAAAANVLLEHDRAVLFTTVPDLLDHLRAAYAPTSEVTYDSLYTLMREVEILVLDDLGAQQTTPWAEEKLFQLINHRYVCRTSTIITTNHIRLSGINERIRSRLLDAGLVQSVTFDEEVNDYRPLNIRQPGKQ
jgi:DNA replication protein DnaC